MWIAQHWKRNIMVFCRRHTQFLSPETCIFCIAQSYIRKGWNITNETEKNDATSYYYTPDSEFNRVIQFMKNKIHMNFKIYHRFIYKISHRLIELFFFSFFFCCFDSIAKCWTWKEKVIYNDILLIYYD